jgi:hypothetical protein
MAEPSGRHRQGLDRQNRRCGAQRKNRHQWALLKPHIGRLGEPGGLLAQRVDKRQPYRKQNMAGSVYRCGEAVVAVAVGESLQGGAKTLAVPAGERLVGNPRRLAQIGWNRLVGLGEQEIEGDDFRPGMIEPLRVPGRRGCAKAATGRGLRGCGRRPGSPRLPAPAVEPRAAGTAGRAKPFQARGSAVCQQRR